MNNKNNKINPVTRINKLFQLYGLYCPSSDELKYIGITTGLLSARLSSHLRNPTNGKIALWFKELKKINKKPLIKLINNYNSYEELLIGEIFEIKRNREKNIELFNVADGGDINPMFGKTHTKEAREKISLAQKGRERTQEEKEHMSKVMSNKYNGGGGFYDWSQEQRNKMSFTQKNNKHAKGYKHTDETKKLLSDLHKGNTYCLGYKHTDETKNKMSKNNSGQKNPMYNKPLSKEILVKRSEKVKKYGVFKGENNPNFKYKIGKEELYELFITKNLKIDAISKIYGCHRTVISDNIKKYNIKKEPSNKYNINLEDIKEYLKNGLSQVDITNIYGCSYNYINKIIKNKINKHE
jgi:hypothetical protein